MGRSEPDAEDVRDALGRILASGDFDASPRSRDFLRFIVEEMLAGRQEGLTQGVIAARVFSRKPDFDPTIDPIVRIQAGRLRRSLERYYLLSGPGDPVRLELPRGAYVPVARWAAASPAEVAPTSARAGASGRTDWPTVVLQLRPADDSTAQGIAARFLENLSVELGRYGDVRILVQAGGTPVSEGRAPTFVLSGRVFDEETSHRVAVRLVDGRTGQQVWADEYRDTRPVSPGFGAETARIVAARVAAEHGVIAQALWRELPPEAATDTPHEALLRSYRFLFTREPSAFVPSLEALGRAVAEDPACSLAWGQLSRLHVANHAFEIAPADTSLEQGLAFAQNAVRLDPSSQKAHAALAFALLVKGEIAAGLAEAGAALASDTRTLVYRETIGWLLALLGAWDRGTALVREAIALNPHHLPIAYHGLWADSLRRGAYDEAYQAALQYRDPAFFWRSVMRASCLGHLGRAGEATAEVAEILRLKPDFARRGRWLLGRLLKFPEALGPVIDGLAKAGLELD